MKDYTGHAWFIKAPLGHYYQCRACRLTFSNARCRSYWYIDDSDEAEAAWDESCPICQEPRVILRKTWFAWFFRTRLWRWINSMRPTPKVFT